MLHGLDLFSGIGGIGIALSNYVRTVAYCERDRYAQSVLLSRMSEGKIDKAPIWDDVTTLRGNMLPEIDIIFGGFPCQDISIAGLGKGLEGERSGLFFEIIRLVKEIGSTFVFLENVPAIRTRGLDQVVKEFTEVGYDCRWTCLSASSVGALHKRERWFLLAHTNSNGCKKSLSLQTRNKGKDLFIRRNGKKESMADSCGKRLERQWKVSSRVEPKFNNIGDDSWWTVEPDVGRVVDGLSNRVDRIKCLGNSVVPIQVKTAFEKLIGIEMLGEE